MTKRKYKKRCKALFKKAKKLGLELEFNPEKFDCKRLDSFWYGGEFATIKVSDELSVVLSICGDVSAYLLDEEGEEIEGVLDNGTLYDNMSPYLSDDDKLFQALENNKLILEDNNWIEYDGIFKVPGTNNYAFTDIGSYGDNKLDGDILEAINEALDDIDSIIDSIKLDIPNDSIDYDYRAGAL